MALVIYIYVSFLTEIFLQKYQQTDYESPYEMMFELFVTFSPSFPQERGGISIY